MKVIALAQLVLAADPPPQRSSGMGDMFMILLLMMVMMYFLIIRPQRKQRKELENRIATLKTGDRVITAGGIHGLVANIKERTVILKMHDNSKIECEKSSISSTIPRGSDKPSEDSAGGGDDDEKATGEDAKS